MPRDYCFGFYNLENYFDTEDSADRPEWLQRALRRELAGWGEAILTQKTANLAKVIASMQDGAGPDILGVCEAENRPVLTRLAAAAGAQTGRSYHVIHADTEDKRGIDTAFLYDEALFTPGAVFQRVIVKRNATRDLLQVTFTEKASGADVVLIANHWPSRLGGVAESAPYRMLAGETLAYWHERILDITGKDTPVIALGDFNDEPFDLSLTAYALALRDEGRVKRGRNPYFYNLMWPLAGSGQGTHYYGGEPSVLDQILVSKPLLKASSSVRVVSGSARRHVTPDNSEGKEPRPRRFGRPSSGLDTGGAGDHFPVSARFRFA